LTETIGFTQIEFMGHPVTFHVTPNNFPITQKGILGSHPRYRKNRISIRSTAGSEIPFVLRETRAVIYEYT